MNSKLHYKEKVQQLRKQGYSYREILQQVPVSKSTVSLWLQNFPLTDEEKKYLKNRTGELSSKGRIRAATALHMNRLIRDKFLLRDAKREYADFRTNPFFFVGVALYWAEGSKRSSQWGFTNSDPEMVKLMVDWVQEFLKVSKEDLRLRLYIHKPYIHENCEEYWSQITGVPVSSFLKTIIKPSGLGVKKRPNYKGCLRMDIGKVSFLRKMRYWEQMLIEEYGK